MKNNKVENDQFMNTKNNNNNLQLLNEEEKKIFLGNNNKIKINLLPITSHKKQFGNKFS